MVDTTSAPKEATDESTDAPNTTKRFSDQEDSEWEKYTGNATLGVDSGFFTALVYDIGSARDDEEVAGAIEIPHHDGRADRVAIRTQASASRNDDEVFAQSRLEFSAAQAESLAHSLLEVAEYVKENSQEGNDE